MAFMSNLTSLGGPHGLAQMTIDASGVVPIIILGGALSDSYLCMIDAIPFIAPARSCNSNTIRRVVPLAGLEPTHLASEASALSSELQGRKIVTQSTYDNLTMWNLASTSITELYANRGNSTQGFLVYTYQLIV